MDELTFISGSEFLHHGILGQKWGVQNGPPYPLERQRNGLSDSVRSDKQKFLTFINKDISDLVAEAKDKKQLKYMQKMDDELLKTSRQIINANESLKLKHINDQLYKEVNEYRRKELDSKMRIQEEKEKSRIRVQEEKEKAKIRAKEEARRIENNNKQEAMKQEQRKKEEKSKNSLASAASKILINAATQVATEYTKDIMKTATKPYVDQLTDSIKKKQGVNK